VKNDLTIDLISYLVADWVYNETYHENLQF